MSARFGAPVIARAAWPAVFAAAGSSVDHLYVVGRDHEEVRDRAGRNCFVQEGMLTIKLATAAAHPLLRAVGADVDSVVDATLGLANDAVHIATVLERARVRGIEASPLVAALLEEGLPRIARERTPGAARVSVEHGHALDVLRAMAAAGDGADVVYLDPMMSRPKRSAPSMALLRELAVDERATPELLAAAAQVARKRVVLKLGRGAPVPPGLAFTRSERGMRVSYWVHDVVAR